MIKNISKIVRKNFILATVLTFSMFIIFWVAVSGRVVYSNNDDYLMSILLANGEKESLFLNVFLTGPLTQLYESFEVVNWFIIIQQSLGVISVFIINYVIISLFSAKWKYAIALLLDTILLCTNVFIIQWTQTSTLMSVSSLLLLFFSIKREKRKCWRITQTICGILIFLIASFFRFDSLVVSIFMVSSAIVVWYVVECYREHQNKISIRTVLVNKMRILLPLVFCFLGVFIVAVGLNYLSNNIKNNVIGFHEYSEYNEYRSRFNDYYVSPFQNNEMFYGTNEIKSQEDLDLVSLHFTDKDFFDSKKLSKIVDYSDLQRYEGRSEIFFSIKDNVKHIKNRILSLREFLPIPIGKNTFLLVFISVGVVIILFLILIFRIMFKRNSHLFYIFRHVFFSFSIVILWGSFFFIYGFSDAGWILIPLCLLSVLSVFIYDKFFFIKCLLVNLFVLIIYCYQSSFRISFRVIYTFAIPALICLCVFLHTAHKTSTIHLTDEKMIVLFLLVSVLCSLGVGAISWNISFAPRLVNYDDALIEYVHSHPENNYVYSSDIYGFLDENYSKASCVPKYLDNVISYGDWDLVSPYRKKVLDSKKVGNLFQTMINNDSYRLLILDTPNLEYKKVHEVYYNNHYAGLQKIQLVKETNITCSVSDWNSNAERTISVYRVIKQ